MAGFVISHQRLCAGWAQVTMRTAFLSPILQMCMLLGKLRTVTLSQLTWRPTVMSHLFLSLILLRDINIRHNNHTFSSPPSSTIWYELQARDWPITNQHVEATIWQVGSGEGIKKVLAEISLGKEVTVSWNGSTNVSVIQKSAYLFCFCKSGK